MSFIFRAGHWGGGGILWCDLKVYSYKKWSAIVDSINSILKWKINQSWILIFDAVIWNRRPLFFPPVVVPSLQAIDLYTHYTIFILSVWILPAISFTFDSLISSSSSFFFFFQGKPFKKSAIESSYFPLVICDSLTACPVELEIVNVATVSRRKSVTAGERES